MAVDKGPVSEQISSSRKNQHNSNAVRSSPAKRNKLPGVRVVGGRVYDPVNGKTCHQCRQKTMDFVAACKNLKKNKPCPIMYCHKCLLNRYGEKAEEVSAREEWSCPKCRDLCNCSICMKKRGHKPTGILANMAKATGFSSVSEMLLVGDTGDNPENAADALVSLKKEVLHSPRKPGKENIVHEKMEVNQHKALEDNAKELALRQSPDKKKRKQVRLENIHDHHGKDGVLPEEDDPRGCKKKVKKLEEGLHKLKMCDDIVTQNMDQAIKLDPEESGEHSESVTKTDSIDPFENGGYTDGVNAFKHKESALHDEIPLPMGTELISVAEIDMLAEDAGNALQFLKFCSVFEKVLELKNRQSKHVLHDIFHGRNGRRAKFSATVQFHIHLLSILLRERGEERSTLTPNSWFDALKNCLSASQNNLKAIGLDSALENASDYETLDASQKLRFLNLLCDEVLGTETIRKWMADQNKKHAEKIKEAKQEVCAAKKKEKNLKQKIKDDMAKAISEKNGAPLSVSEHEAITTRIKSEVAEAHAKVLESKSVLSKTNETSDTSIRIEPIFTGKGGNVYWDLNCSGTFDILRQNVGEGDSLTFDDKWFTMDDEEKIAVEKLTLRGKKSTSRS